MSDCAAPGVVCLEQPRVDDTELVISWSYNYTGGLNIPDTVVEYQTEDSKAFTLVPYFIGGSASGSSASGEVAIIESSISLPLPVAGVNYFFRVTASNEEGSTTVPCPSIFLTTGNNYALSFV